MVVEKPRCKAEPQKPPMGVASQVSRHRTKKHIEIDLRELHFIR